MEHICKECQQAMQMVKRYISDGRLQIVHQCQCGNADHQPIKQTPSILDSVSAIYDDDAYKQFRFRRAMLKSKASRERYALYEEYLMTPEWNAKRKERLDLDHWICQSCGGPAIQVHHKTYDNLYHETMDDLVSLCYECHMRLHGVKL